MVLLMGGSIVLMPLILPLMLPGLDADPWSMAKPLLLILLMPLAIGLALALCMPAWTKVLLPLVRKASNITLLVLISLTIALNLKTVLGTFGSFAVATYVVYLLALFGAAYLIGSFDPPTQAVFALGAGSRNVAAALVIASASFNDPAVTVSWSLRLWSATSCCFHSRDECARGELDHAHAEPIGVISVRGRNSLLRAKLLFVAAVFATSTRSRPLKTWEGVAEAGHQVKRGANGRTRGFARCRCSLGGRPQNRALTRSLCD